MIQVRAGWSELRTLLECYWDVRSFKLSTVSPLGKVKWVEQVKCATIERMLTEQILEMCEAVEKGVWNELLLDIVDILYDSVCRFISSASAFDAHSQHEEKTNVQE